MKVISPSFSDGGPLPPAFAFCKPDATTRVALSDNRNPALAWSEAPEGTRSFAVICHDRDVPSKPDDVNQVDREVPDSLARVDFYHWVLVDVPATTSRIAEGEFSHQVSPKGKSGPESRHGTRQGVNDFTQWFASDHDMRGDYYGYDGPCPPWNDALVHHYVFTVYALDVDRLPLEGRFDGRQAREVIDAHKLGSVSIMATYTLNARLIGSAAG
jgi:Raf kinase inhibitor-like YbhB/YbcL family protein